MKKKHSRGNCRSKVQVLDLKKQIFDLLPKHSDIEIMDMLEIPLQTFYRYKTQIFSEAKELWHSLCSDSLEYRALQIKQTLDKTYRISESIAEDPKEKATDRLQACDTMFSAQEGQFTLVAQSPLYFKEEVIQPPAVVEPYVDNHQWEQNARNVKKKKAK